MVKYAYFFLGKKGMNHFITPFISKRLLHYNLRGLQSILELFVGYYYPTRPQLD